MNRERTAMSLLFPLLAVLTVVVFLGALGGTFIFVDLNTALEEWAVIIIGVSLVVGVPIVAYILERSIARE